MKDSRLTEIGINKLVKVDKEANLTPLPTDTEKKIKEHFRIRLSTPCKSPRPSCSSVRLKKNLEILQRPNSMKASTISRATLLRFKSKIPQVPRQLLSTQSKAIESTLPKPRQEEEEQEKNSFTERYLPKKRVFFHRIIGKLKLPSKEFKIASRDLDPQDTPVTKSKLFEGPYSSPYPKFNPTFLIPDIKIGHYVIKCLNKNDLYRKVLSAVAHYKALHLQRNSLKRLKEFFPGRPFGLHKSEKFLKACKDGNVLLVNYMLQSQKWLAHVYDYSGLTALHWAVIRDKVEVVRVLVQQGVYVDVNDYVPFI